MRDARADDVIAKALQSALAGDGTVNNVPQTMLAERVLTALSSAGIDCEGWRDIESAPKDGTDILLYCPPPPGTYISGQLPDSGYTLVEIGAFIDGRWEFRGLYDEEFLFPPTHWRPLPLPPLASGGG